MKSSIERIRDRLEKILVPAIAAPVDESMRQRVESGIEAIAVAVNVFRRQAASF